MSKLFLSLTLILSSFILLSFVTAEYEGSEPSIYNYYSGTATDHALLQCPNVYEVSWAWPENYYDVHEHTSIAQYVKYNSTECKCPTYTGTPAPTYAYTPTTDYPADYYAPTFKCYTKIKTTTIVETTVSIQKLNPYACYPSLTCPPKPTVQTTYAPTYPATYAPTTYDTTP